MYLLPYVPTMVLFLLLHISVKQNFLEKQKNPPCFVVKNKYSNLLSTENELLLCLTLPTAPKQICDSKQTHLSH